MSCIWPFAGLIGILFQFRWMPRHGQTSSLTQLKEVQFKLRRSDAPTVLGSVGSLVCTSSGTDTGGVQLQMQFK